MTRRVVKARPDDELYVLWDEPQQMPFRWWDAGSRCVFSRDWPHPDVSRPEMDRADLLGSSIAEAPAWRQCVPIGWNGADVHRGLLPHALLLDFAVMLRYASVDHAATLVHRYGALVPR